MRPITPECEEESRSLGSARLRAVVVLIPALNPEPALIGYVSRLMELGFERVIVVNDGSATQTVFHQLAEMGSDVLHHAVNLGKGRALKTGLNHFLLHYPNRCGLVTADADGQHLPEDTVRVAEELLDHPSMLVLGVRRFGAEVPWRSLLGNQMTRWLYALLAGKWITDTQCGLRGIPRQAVPGLLRLTGEHYEYEMQMLVAIQALALEIRELPIATIYTSGNASSHFRPVLDSMRIYVVLFRFYLSSLLASGLDLAFFTITYGLTSNLLLSLLLGRTIFGAAVNFGINKLYVFHNKSAPLVPLLKYYLLLVCLAGLSYSCIRAMSGKLGWNVIVCKILVETPLSLLSFAVQRTFVFNAASDDAGV
jgi:glycosyltransferase involved in cell wall biosynthesis